MNLKKPTIEALKEGARLLLLLVVSFVVSFLLEQVIPTLDSTQSTVVLTFALRMIDKWIHENVFVGPKMVREANGLVPF